MFAFLGLAAFAIGIVLPLYLLFVQRNLLERIEQLERDMAIANPADAPVPPSAQVTTRDKMPRRPAATAAWPERAAPAARVDSAGTSSPPQAFVFKAQLGARLTVWLQKNWFYAVAAVSFAFAGVFLVQYGVENGVLTPAMRVVAAMVLGAVLIGGGEYIRRRSAGDEGGSFVFLPSVLSGAGLVALFAAILAARMMYGLIGPQTGFAGLALTGVLAIVLGWYYGPLLAIVGVFGAIAAPFLVGGDSAATDWLYLYFAGIAVVALSIDSVKRWAWLSALGLIGTYGAALLVLVASQDVVFADLFALIVAAAAIMIPVRSLKPRHGGAMVTQTSSVLVDGKPTLPEFPTRVGAGAFAASVLMFGWGYAGVPDGFWLTLGGLVVMVGAAGLWLRHAPALGDLVFAPLAMLPVLVMAESAFDGPVYAGWVQASVRDTLDFAPPTAAIILGGALAISMLLAWRSRNGAPYPLFLAGSAAAFAPLVAAILEVFWNPAGVLGAGVWAVYLAGVAAVMTGLAGWFSGRDGAARTRTALFAVSAMAMLAFIAVVVLGDVTLTLVLGVLAAAAAWLGRRFGLALMDRYVQAAILALTWRLVVDPGIWWSLDADLWRVVLANAGAVALLVLARFVQRPGARRGVVVMQESAVWSLGGIFASLMVARYFDSFGVDDLYLYMSVFAVVWLIASAGQLHRLRAGEELRRTRRVLATLYGIAGLGAMVVAAGMLNPLFDGNGLVYGPYLLDSLAAAYALPALVTGIVAVRFTHLPQFLRRAAGGVAAALGALYLGLEIRRWWQGDTLSVAGVRAGELYTYTVAMLAVAVILLVLAVLRRAPVLRRLMLVAVGLTVAKVYLIDMSGLDGLLRVAAFLIIGLVVGAMAWVNRIMQKSEAAESGPDAPATAE